MPISNLTGVPIEYEIESLSWRWYSQGIEVREVQLSPDPTGYYYVMPGVRDNPPRNIYVGWRCMHCHREFNVDDIPEFINAGLSYRVTDALIQQAFACHRPCEACGVVECGLEHVYCNTCDHWDCCLSEEEHVYCDTCDMYNCGRLHSIHGYGYKPRPVWLGGTRQPYYLGFELEVSSNNERVDAQRILEWANANMGENSLYCKEDGSVQGFEIVSHPMTPEFFEAIDWRSFFATVRENDSDSTYEPRGHGLHVHVSRTAFHNHLTLARWVYLWNARFNRQTAVQLCRRQSDEWAAFRDNDVQQIAKVAKSERSWINNRFYPDFPRYSLINLQNSETVEFRGFRSTRRADHFRQSIRSIYRSVDYVRSMQPCHATGIHNDYSLAVATGNAN